MPPSTPAAVTATGRPATDPAGPTGRLATWVAKTTLDDVPASVRDRAKHLVLDGIGCALVGAQLPWSRIGVQGVTALDDAGDSVLIGWGGRATSATSAAMVNSSFIQGFELDDYHPLAPLHSNSLVLPAMLAAAPRVGRVSGASFLLGAILGYETGPRVGQALGGLDMLSRGWHSGVVFGPLAAAAAAGSLYGLDAAGFEDAFGMAATQSCGLMSAMYESMVKRMQHGFASRNGLTAAALAAVGYVGIKRVFERPYGGWLAAQICRACVAGLSLGGKKIPGSLAVQSACTLHTRLVSAAACSRSGGDSSSRASGMVASSGMRKAPLLMGQGSTPRAYTLMWTMLLTLKLKFMDLSTGLSVQRRLSHLSSQRRPAAPVAEVWSAARRGGLCAICPCRGWLAGPRRSCLPPPGHFRSCP